VTKSPLEQLRMHYRGQFPPEDKLLSLIREGRRFSFPTTHTASDNEIENILQIHRQVTGWAVPSEKFAVWLLRRKNFKKEE